MTVRRRPCIVVRMLGRTPGFAVLASFTLLAGCEPAADDEDADRGRYASVDEWVCFEGATRCMCFGLEGNSDVGSSDPEVARCTYPECFAGHASGIDGPSPRWSCTCGPPGHMLAAGWLDVEPVPSCPPE